MLWEWLPNEHFEELGFDESARNVLYRDPNTRSFGHLGGVWVTGCILTRLHMLAPTGSMKREMSALSRITSYGMPEKLTSLPLRTDKAAKLFGNSADYSSAGSEAYRHDYRTASCAHYSTRTAGEAIFSCLIMEDGQVTASRIQLLHMA